MKSSTLVLCLLFTLSTMCLDCTFANIITESKFVTATLCEKDDDCEDIPKARCWQNYCRCEGNNLCDDSEANLVVTKVGGFCRNNRSCNIDNAFCDNGVCRCVDGVINSLDGKRCLKLSSGIDDFCDEDVQCSVVVPHSFCLNKLCTCEANRHVENGECYKTVDLGEFCHNDEECSQTDFSECRNNVCNCVKRYVAHENRCLLRAKGLKSTCTEDIQCSAVMGNGSDCEDSFCVCKEDFRYKPSINKCVKNMRYKDKCDTDSDCHEQGHSHSRLGCRKGLCQCKPYYRDDDGHCKSESSKPKAAVVLCLLSSILSYVY